jgi:regulator of replication initiation timing
MDKELKNRLSNLINPLYNVVDAFDMLLTEIKSLEAENKKLKERLSWYEKSLEENAKASGEAIHDFISACVEGRIKVEDNKTIIDHEAICGSK